MNRTQFRITINVLLICYLGYDTYEMCTKKNVNFKEIAKISSDILNYVSGNIGGNCNE